MNSDTVLMRMLVIGGIVSLAFLAGCGGGTSQSLNNQPASPSGSNPPPSGSSTPPSGTNPSSVAVAPDPTGKFGKFAYVANYGSNNVSM